MKGPIFSMYTEDSPIVPSLLILSLGKTAIGVASDSRNQGYNFCSSLSIIHFPVVIVAC